MRFSVFSTAVGIITSLFLHAAVSAALPRYQLVDLGPTGKPGITAPHKMWRLTPDGETILGKNYLTGSGAVALPPDTLEASGPTDDGFVYLRLPAGYFWWHKDSGITGPAPAGLEAISGNGAGARGEQFQSGPGLVRFQPFSLTAIPVYQSATCGSPGCSIKAAGISDSGITISETDVQKRLDTAVIDACELGPMNSNGAFLFAIHCGSPQFAWQYSAGGLLPAVQDGVVTWHSINNGHLFAGTVSGSQDRGILSLNSVHTNLDDMVPSFLGYHIAAAFAVNDSASVLAIGYKSGNASDPRAILLTEAAFTVNTALDGTDRNVGDGICDASNTAGEQCSLRAAIQEANYSPGMSEIRFAIPGDSVPVINLTRELPDITEPIRILGTSQPRTGQVGLNGAHAGSSSSALSLLRSGNTVTGLRIYDFGLNGINLVTGAGSRIERNTFGITPDGSARNLGGYAVFLSESSGNSITRNTVANALLSGIGIDSGSERNRVTSNSFFGNRELAIDLNLDRSTANHGPGDATGANRLQNFPVISSARGGSVTGSLAGKPGSTYRVELYASECSGNRGQGAALLQSFDVQTDSTGSASFGTTAAEDAITAIATDKDGNTSEFSPLVGTDEESPTSCASSTGVRGRTVSLRGGSGTLRFFCSPRSRCTGTLKLLYRRPGRATSRFTTVAQSSFASAKNGRVSSRFTLNRRGRELLSKGKGKLAAAAVANMTVENGLRSASVLNLLLKGS